MMGEKRKLAICSSTCSRTDGLGALQVHVTQALTPGQRVRVPSPPSPNAGFTPSALCSIMATRAWATAKSSRRACRGLFRFYRAAGRSSEVPRRTRATRVGPYNEHERSRAAGVRGGGHGAVLAAIRTPAGRRQILLRRRAVRALHRAEAPRALDDPELCPTR